MKKKGIQYYGSSAGSLIGIILLVILFYILFLPPDERADLLGDNNRPPIGNPDGSDISNPINIRERRGVILSESPGSLSVPDEVLSKYLPNVFIAETVSSTVLAQVSPVYISNGVFDTKKSVKEATFSLRDTENIDNIILSFNAPKRKGTLSIFLNDDKIYEYILMKENPEPVKIDPGLLRAKNTLTFAVDGVGLAFWRTNEYALESIRVVGDVIDVSQQESRNIFVLTQTEFDNLERATLRFVPYCSSQRDIGALDVLINNKVVFSAVPVCDDPYFIPLSKGKLKEGENSVIFVTSKGRYSIEQIKVDFEEKKFKSKIYYFEMEPELFFGYEIVVSEADCGLFDGICPEFCDEDIDQDCCFLDSDDNFWCDTEPDDADDRCVSAVDQNKCARCPSGYEDDSDDPPKACEELCGDDTDDLCPENCDLNYDKDCCFEDNEDNYWCNDMPITGLTSTCERALTSGECDDCPSGYRTDSGSRYDCLTGLEPVIIEEEDVLRPELNAVLYVDFVDNDRNKDMDIIINGHRANIDQDRPYYSRDISDWVRADNNYLELFPVTPVSIVKLEIRIE